MYSALINGQRALIQLQDRAVDGGGVNAADAPGAAGAPAAVGALRALQVVEHGRPVLAPGHALALGRAGEHLFPAVVAEDINGLGVVVMSILIVAKADADAADRDGALAVLEPLPAQFVLVLAGVEEAGDGGGGERRPFAADRRPHPPSPETVD